METNEDFQATLKGVLSSTLDMVIATKLVPYPGTPLYESDRANAVFSLFPYNCRFMHERRVEETIALEKYLYKKFYFRFGQVMRLIRVMLRAPFGDTMKLAADFIAFLFRPKKKEHPDFL
jgi:hypothetical protein